MHLHAKDLASHSTLKLRHAKPISIDEMKNSLDEKEATSKLSLTGNNLFPSQKQNHQVQHLNESTVAILNQDKDDSSDSSESSDVDNINDNDEDDSDDDTSDLIKELEKIKKERKDALERTRLLQEQVVQDEIEANAAQGNPLLMNQNSIVKRKWDDDVVFKNQGGLITAPKPKRFINDLIRSDFHKKFMGKYMN